MVQAGRVHGDGSQKMHMVTPCKTWERNVPFLVRQLEIPGFKFYGFQVDGN